MGKLLFLIFVGVLLYLAFARPKRAPRAKPKSASAESMIQCAYCDVHVPLSESFTAEGLRYCCEEHRRLGQG